MRRKTLILGESESENEKNDRFEDDSQAQDF